MKLSVLLAKTDQLSGSYKAMVTDYIKFFKGNQGAFKGFKKTYEPFEGTVDEPNLRGSQNVVTTVKEKLDWFVETSSDYINAVFSQEATNASGGVKAELVVEGKSLGSYSTLELLRLKMLLESQDLNNLYSQMPVREETKNWTRSTNVEHEDREIYQDSILQGTKKTTEKESYILPDPNLDKIDGAKYTPQIAVKNTVMSLGEYTQQNFSGETTHRHRADVLRRKTILLTAVVTALKEANDKAEAVKSGMTAEKLFSYLHDGVINE